MPEHYDYSEPSRLLSLARLTSYRTSLATQTDAQLFGSYCWNLAIVGAFIHYCNSLKYLFEMRLIMLLLQNIRLQINIGLS